MTSDAESPGLIQQIMYGWGVGIGGAILLVGSGFYRAGEVRIGVATILLGALVFLFFVNQWRSA